MQLVIIHPINRRMAQLLIKKKATLTNQNTDSLLETMKTLKYKGY